MRGYAQSVSRFQVIQGDGEDAELRDDLVDLLDTMQAMLSAARECAVAGDLASVGSLTRDLGQGVEDVLARCPADTTPS